LISDASLHASPSTTTAAPCPSAPKLAPFACATLLPSTRNMTRKHPRRPMTRPPSPLYHRHVRGRPRPPTPPALRKVGAPAPGRWSTRSWAGGALHVGGGALHAHVHVHVHVHAHVGGEGLAGCLGHHEAVVDASLLHKRVVVAALVDLALVDHGDQVRVANG